MDQAPTDQVPLPPAARLSEQKQRQLTMVAQDQLDRLIDDVTFGLVLENHRAAKHGYLFIDVDEEDDNDVSHSLVLQNGVDVFGEAIGNGQAKRQVECNCPSCDRTIAASRFAPHLEKCMGMGRKSSRQATKRIASVASKATNGQDSDDIDDYDNSGDMDWNYNPDSKKRKKKDKTNGLVKRAAKRDRGGGGGGGLNSRVQNSHN